jgi:hypothetical protein
MRAGYVIQSFTDATGAPGIMKCISPSTYTLLGSDICAGANITLTLSGSQNGWRYQLYKDNIPVSNPKNGTGSALAFSETSTDIGRFNYTVWTVDTTGMQCEIQVNNVLAITVNPIPIITRSGGDASQIVYQNTAITAMTYTASNAATIAMTGSFPEGVTGNASGSSYTISGMPSATGTFGYSLTAALGSCTSTAVVGTLTVYNPNTPHAASTQTWTYGTATWSDRIVATPMECILTDDLSTTDHAALEYRVYESRVYYKGSCLNAIQNAVCPDPWRAPTLADLRYAATHGWERISADWGWGGYALGPDMVGVGVSGRLVSIDTTNPSRSNFYLRWEIDGAMVTSTAKAAHASEVRCVK